MCGHHHSLYGLRKGTADLAKFERAYEASRAEESTCPEVVNETELAVMNEKLEAGYKRCTEALERGLGLSHEEVMPVFEPWVSTLSFDQMCDALTLASRLRSARRLLLLGNIVNTAPRLPIIERV